MEEENYKLPADELIPIFYFVVVRASVLQLGSEIDFIKDFMEDYLMNGQIGYALTTVMVSFNFKNSLAQFVYLEI